MSLLLPAGVEASTYRVEILEPNSMSVETYEGRLLSVQSRCLSNYAVIKQAQDMKELCNGQIEDLVGKYEP